MIQSYHNSDRGSVGDKEINALGGSKPLPIIKTQSLDTLLDDFRNERREVSKKFLENSIGYEEYHRLSHNITLKYYKLTLELPN